MANTTFSTTDHSANITLSNGNLTATASAGATWARAADKQLPGGGKFYWEFLGNPFVSGSSGHGFCPSALGLPSGSSFASMAGIDRNGSIWVNGSFTGTTIGSTVNVTVSVALDLNGKLVWFRLAPSGNWNNSGTANPGTGAGGISVSSVTGVDAVPVATFGTANDAMTANFGSSAFSGAVPSGFTSGWPGAGGGAGAAQARVMVLA